MSQTYANSYLSVYDEVLNEVFGLFAVSQNMTEEQQNDLKEYVLTTISPMIRDYTHASGSKVTSLFDKDNKGAIAPFITMVNQNENAKPVDLLNAQLKGSLDDNDALMMQIAEYIKLIGPADLTINLSQDLLNKLKGESEDSKTNYDILKEKKKLDDQLDELSNAVSELSKAMQNYDAEVEKTFNAYTSYAMEIVISYQKYYGEYHELFKTGGDAYNVLEKIIGEFVETRKSGDGIYKYSDGAVYLKPEDIDVTNETDESLLRLIIKNCYRGDYSYDSDSDKNYVEQFNTAMSRFSRLSEINRMVDYSNTSEVSSKDFPKETDKIGRYIPKNIEKYNNCGKSGDNCGNEGFLCLEHLKKLRDDVAAKARAIETAKESIRQKIQNMKDKANEPTASDYSKTLVEGIQKDYAVLDDIDHPETDLYKIMHYDFNKFADWVQTWEANKMFGDGSHDGIHNKLEQAMTKIMKYDDSLYKIWFHTNKIKNYINNGGADAGDFFRAIGFLVGLEFSFDQPRYLDDCLPAEDLIDWGDVPNGNTIDGFYSQELKDYYTKMAENTTVISGTEISVKAMYDIAKSWSTTTDSEVEDLANKLTETITSTLESLTKNKVQPRCKRVMPTGTDEAEEETIDLNNILDEKNESSLPTSQNSSGELSAFESYINKLLLVMYDYDTFTCHTSDKKYNKDEKKVEVIQPESVQGVKQAKTLNDAKDGFTESETNYLLFAEMEYIFGGNKDSVKNFSKVRNSLAVIRFVPNYISTYTISEINTLMLNIQAALAWCPPAAIVAVQLLRVAIAALETFCDLDLLYSGKPVLLYKKEIGDMSFLQKLSDDALDALNDLGEKASSEALKNTGKSEKPTSFTQMNDHDQGDGIRVTYDQYLLLLTVIFVNKQTLLDRTADLIEVNMSYINAGGKTSTDDDGNEQPIELTWKCSKAFTCVEATSSVHTDFLFMDKIFNLSDKEEDFSAEIAEMTSGDNMYSYKVQLSY